MGRIDVHDHPAATEIFLIGGESAFRKIDARKTDVGKVAKADIEKVLGRHARDDPRIGVEHRAARRSMRSAQVNGRHAQVGDGFGNFFVFDAGDDAVALPRLEKLRHAFGQSAFDVQNAPAAVRTDIRGDAEQAAATVRA